MKYEISRKTFRYLLLILVFTQSLIINEWLNYLLGLNIFSFSNFVKHLPTFLPPFIGVLFAFEINRIWENYEFNKRVRQIVPYIYLELYQNLGLIYEWEDDNNKFIEKSKRFDTSHWEMFKEELAKWRQVNIVPLTRIYYNINRVNTLLKDYNIKMIEEIKKALGISKNLIVRQIERYEIWFEKNVKAKIQLDLVIDEYKLVSEIDEDLRSIIIARLIRAQNKLNEKPPMSDQ